MPCDPALADTADFAKQYGCLLLLRDASQNLVKCLRICVRPATPRLPLRCACFNSIDAFASNLDRHALSYVIHRSAPRLLGDRQNARFEMADSANAILVQGKGKGNPVFISIPQHSLAFVSIHQHSSASISIQQHPSAFISIHPDYI